MVSLIYYLDKIEFINKGISEFESDVLEAYVFDSEKSYHYIKGYGLISLVKDEKSFDETILINPNFKNDSGINKYIMRNYYNFNSDGILYITSTAPFLLREE